MFDCAVEIARQKPINIIFDTRVKDNKEVFF